MTKAPAKKTRKARGPSQTKATTKRAPRADVANAAIHFAFDAYDTSRPKLMGRHTAGEGFIAGFAKHAVADEMMCFARNQKDFAGFKNLLGRHGNRRPSVWFPYHEPHKLAQAGCLYTPDPNITRYAWARRRHDQRAYSLVGVFHTTASHGVMSEICNTLVAPVQPWDAVICPTKAVRSKAERLIEWQADYLSHRIGGKAKQVHQLPIIPLGVDCDQFDPSTKEAQEARKAFRKRFDVGDDDIVVLFVGRLAFHAKANPMPMYAGLEEAAKRTGKKTVLVMSGWFGSDTVRDQFASAAKILSPTLKVVSVDGRKDDVRFRVWQAADIFASMSDNIQETFGLTPIEAMAAGLPVVCSEWNGYRDTVINGETGIMVPTLMAPPGDGDDLAYRHDAGTDDYDHYVGTAAQFTAVDPFKVADAFEALMVNPDLRRSMGEAGRRRAETTYDWKVIIGQYQQLWAELEGRRKKSKAVAPKQSGAPAYPARADPFDLFQHYPTALVDDERVFDLGNKTVKQAVDLAFMARLNSTMNAPDHHIAAVLQHIQEHGPTETGVLLDLVGRHARVRLRRTLVWLAKVGVLKIVW